jgi:hypothetical protein
VRTEVSPTLVASANIFVEFGSGAADLIDHRDLHQNENNRNLYMISVASWLIPVSFGPIKRRRRDNVLLRRNFEGSLRQQLRLRHGLHKPQTAKHIE